MADFEIPKHSVIQYVRDKKRIPYGVIVAVKNSQGFTVGYSQCNKKDRFNKRMALKIAISRATDTGWNACHGVDPHAIDKMIPAFVERCKKYYKEPVA